eukprot:c8375_g1_i3.p1 GENE.c8375_g1_i3~~c8375_g1_i3.p1  ORF type:complete len:156 (-),score=41.66 c8375_g1_i3:8-475(-)
MSRKTACETGPVSLVQNLLDFKTATEPPFGPEMALMRSNHAGDCWAACGSQSSLTLQLAKPSIVESIVLEHVPYAVATYQSALKKFVVRGFENVDESPILHFDGEFHMDERHPHVQLFPLPEAKPISVLQLETLTNHGNADFTCLYRLRVYGKQQ